ncbi:MAG: DUF979 domain-containing protein [Caulobacteraceae bacterium]
MIRLGAVYLLMGLLFAAYAAFGVLDRTKPNRWRDGFFFTLLAASFLAGDRLGDLANGVVVIGLTALAAVGRRAPAVHGTGDDALRIGGAARYKDRLFLLALITPAVALLGAVALKGVHVGAQPLVDPKQTTVISLALGVLAALLVSLVVLRERPVRAVQEGRRLMEQVGWAAILPQMLAALGAVFALAGVGHSVAALLGQVLPTDNRLAVVCTYTCGMALFTAMVGNAFAAFPVMTAAIGLPLIVQRFHGDPAIMGAIGMLSGFCGTLLTPMAANYNIVPVALLGLPDRWAVIRVQAPTAFAMLAINTALMYALVFRF